MPTGYEGSEQLVRRATVARQHPLPQQPASPSPVYNYHHHHHQQEHLYYHQHLSSTPSPDYHRDRLFVNGSNKGFDEVVAIGGQDSDYYTTPEEAIPAIVVTAVAEKDRQKGLLVRICNSMSNLVGRYLRTWRSKLVVAICVTMVVYILVHQSRVNIDMEEVKIDIKDIERELENAKPLQVVTYKPPHQDRLDDDPDEMDQNKAAAVAEVQRGHAARTLKYHHIWAWAYQVTNIHELFPDTPDVDAVLEALATARIVNADILDVGEYESGTSEKWILMLEGGQKAVMKIAWEPMGRRKDNSQCNFGYEMPHGEIAGFHLHRLMGFRNTPYVTGRRVHLRNEILPVASPLVAKQITLKGNKTCVTGKCYYCDEAKTMCPADGFVEASIAYWIPRHLKLFTYPPKFMPFSTPRDDEWRGIGLNNHTYCNRVREMHPYDIDRYFHDLFDFAVVDSLMYHYDSKHYLIYDDTDARGLTVRIDHGRAFCEYRHDEEDVFLAPVVQCCTIRRATVDAIHILSNNQLSKKLREALAGDPLSPILDDQFYVALDRRVAKIADVINRCAQANQGIENILVG